MKKIIMCGFLLLIVGCASTNPPAPPKAEGNWEFVKTVPNDLIRL